MRNDIELATSTRLGGLDVYSRFQSKIPGLEMRHGRYLIRFARNRFEVEQALRLRFEVFNLELGEGLESSFQTGLDRDEFDEACHHLVVLDERQAKVVGTYRLQTGEMAAAGAGFYSSGEFELSSLPDGVLENSVELGRACVDRAHRNTQVLFLLWKGIAAYVAYNCKRYLFGCCSLTSQDEELGQTVYRFLERAGALHPNFQLVPRPGMECTPSNEPLEPGEPALPKLFRIYLRFGAKVLGPPALDRTFKTIDFFVMFDVDAMDRRSRQLFFGG